MKILFPVTKFYPVQSGGPIYTLLWHCTSLVEKGVSVYIITTNTGFSSIRGEKPKMNSFSDTKMGRIIYLSGYLKLLNQLKYVFKNLSDADVLHLNSFFSPVSFLSFLLLLLSGQKMTVIWSVRGEFNQEALKFNTHKKKPILWLLKRTTKQVAFHSTSPQETLDIKCALGERKIIEIPNLIKLEPPLNIEKKSQFIFMGRIHPIKCIENLLLALHKSGLFKKSSYSLLIVGRYEQRYTWYYQSLIEMTKKYQLTEKVKFKNHVVGDEKWRLYASSKFLFLPSMSENFGNVVVESLSQSTPVVASKGTPWNILEKHKAGFHIENDPVILSRKIDMIINMTDYDYTNYSQNALRLAQSHFNIDEKIQEWLTVYGQKLKKSK
ncbi:MAG: glycosyltransferase family 4 protein [Bacteroidota bacterium]